MTFPAVLNLEYLDGEKGFGIVGEDNIGFSGGSLSGFSVSGAGDINGDGFDDVIIGAPRFDAFSVAGSLVGTPLSISVGKSYVVFGGNEDFTNPLELSSLDGNNGFGIEPNNDIDRFGSSVSGIGDINGDGFDDFIIGAPYPRNTTDIGRTYLIFGSDAGFPDMLSSINLDDNNSDVFRGSFDGDLFGHSVSGAGDINGDGFDDVIIGAPEAGSSREGISYLIFGNSAGTDFAFTAFVGIDKDDFLGGSVSGAGDINGDGIDDLIIGADEAEDNITDQGETYIVFGDRNGFGEEFDLTSLNGNNGFVIRGIDENDYSGFSVSDAGDVNGDGFDDIIIGARDAGNDSGESYVIFGKSLAFDAELNLAGFNASDGFTIRGIDEGDLSGYSVSGAGDINSDGFDDIIISALNAEADLTDQGETYVIFGKSTGFAAEFDLTTLNGSNGFVFRGYNANDNSGRSVSGAGDVNGDGIDDIIVGAFRAEPGDSSNDDRGQSYVIFGVESTGIPNDEPIVWRDLTNGRTSIWYMNLNEKVDRNTIDAPDLDWELQATEDFNQDGNSDLIWRNSITGENTIWEMDGSQKKERSILDPVSDTSFKIKGAGDFNNDGNRDLIWRNTKDGRTSIWLMDGTDKISSLSLDSSPDIVWDLAGVGDFDRDGYADIVWRNLATGNNTIWYMKEGEKIDRVSLDPVTNLNWQLEGVRDFNNDANPDLLWRNYSTGDNRIWIMDGVTKKESLIIDSVGDPNFAPTI